MEMSEKCDELFAAYSKFQGDLSNAAKSKAGHGYKYADLAACIDIAKDPLLQNGLAVAQFLGQTEKGTTLTTMMTHSSGQWMRDTFLMEKAVLSGGAGKNPAQGMGASITYMRRYSFAAITGMTQEDEDAANVKAEIKRVKQDPDIQEIITAANINNIQYITDNWSGKITTKWQQLPPETTAKLNDMNGAQQ